MDKETDISIQDSATLVPGVSSSYGNGWRQLRKFFLALFLVGLVGFLFSLPGEYEIGVWIGGWFGIGDRWTILLFFALVYTFLVAGPVGFGVAFAYLKASRGDKPEIKDAFAAFTFNNYGNTVLANLLLFVIIVLGFIVLIIPGIIFSCKLAFTPYLIIDRKMGAIEAIKESWRMTGGHAWKVFFVSLLSIPILIAGLICLGVGVIISIMWIDLALATLYHAVSMPRQTSGY